jgi:hypothetical protein
MTALAVSSWPRKIIGIGGIGLNRATLVWAGQATEHDHTHGADAPATSALSQTPAPPDGLRMSKMRQDMMRMQMDTQGKMMEQICRRIR